MFLPRILCLALITATSGLLAEDWPHWRGSSRTDITTESSGYQTGKPWPPAGALWKMNAGEGAASPLVVGDVVYTIGWANNSDTVRAIDPATGKTIWEQTYPAPKYGRHAVGDQRMYRGATATPEYDPATGALYTLSCDGDLRAWNTGKGGAPIWNLNLYKQFEVPKRPQITTRKNTLRDYGYTTAPLVFENWVIVEVGDPKSGNLQAFDKITGKHVWGSENRDVAGHTGGLAPMTIDGVPCVAVATSYHALVVRLDGRNAGKTVAEFPWATDFSNTIAGIAARGNELLISSHYNQKAMAKVAISLKDGAREVWRNQHSTGVCTPVIHGDHLYFANKGIHCVDFETGKLVWEGGKIGDAGSCLVTADERLIVWGNGGDLSIVDTAKRSPDEINILAVKTNILNEMAWPHVVLANGRVYCKTTNGELVCFSLMGEKPATPPTTTAVEPEKLNYTAWDASHPTGQIWSWKQGDGASKRSSAARRAGLVPRTDAVITTTGALHFSGGGIVLNGVSTPLLEACKKSGAFSIELVFTTDNVAQKGPARIVSFSKDPYERNFTLGQEGKNLTLRLRTPKTGKNGSSPEVTLWEIPQSRVNRVCLTYEQGSIVFYHNGKPVMTTDKVDGDFSNWDEVEQGLILGDEWAGGSRFWEGMIFAIAFYDRALTEKEVGARDQLLAQ